MSTTTDPRGPRAPKRTGLTAATTTTNTAAGTMHGSTTGPTKGRVSSNRLVDDGELNPSDSASNAPHRRRTASDSQGDGGAGRFQQQQQHSQQRSIHDRRSEKSRITTRDTVQVRTRSPVKAQDSDGSSGHQNGFRDAVTRQPDRWQAEYEGAQAKTETKASVAWKPQASLVAHTTAPLASRVSLPPLASLLPQALKPPPLSSLSLEAQEAAIVEDLLFAFMGYEGQYIRLSKSYNPVEEKDRLAGPEFWILPGLDLSLRDLTTTMLKMATDYVAVEAFVEVLSQEAYGMINHALCASIRLILREYLVLIAQMEHQMITNQAFTLHVLHLHILPTSHILSQIYTLAQQMLRKNNMLDEDQESEDELDVDDIIEQLKDGGDFGLGTSKKIFKGGNVLRLLTERLSHMSGDPAARKLLEGLLRDASKPYMVMLNEWLHHGSIRDPHGEFLIREQKSINRENLEEDYTDEYWEKRYTIREHEVPPQLEAVKEKVLLAGKYLNVVRECGGVDISTEVTDVPTSFEDPHFLKNISSAYAHANSSLLNLLLTTHELSARLRSMKHYFFLDRSDFFSYFLYLSNSELKKPMKEVNVGKLQSLLDLVLRQPGTVAAQDPYKEDVKIHMNDQNLTKFLMSVVNVRGFEEGNEENMARRTPAAKDEAEEMSKMTGYDALEFRYTVPFPLSLVISSKTVVRYQILFRYLLSMRHLEGLIVNCWEDHNKVVSWTHKSKDRRLEIWKRRAWTLRARMLNFVQQFMYYCTVEVIEPNWHSLMAKVNGIDQSGKPASRTVDELMEDHVDFLDTCLKECMLMNSKLLKIHDKLISCCTFFAIYTSSMSRTLCAADADLAGSPAATAYLATLYPSARHPTPDRLLRFDADAVPRIVESLEKYEENFNRHIRILLDALDYYAATETVALSRLCAQLSVASEKVGEERLV